MNTDTPAENTSSNHHQRRGILKTNSQAKKLRVSYAGQGGETEASSAEKRQRKPMVRFAEKNKKRTIKGKKFTATVGKRKRPGGHVFRRRAKAS